MWTFYRDDGTTWTGDTPEEACINAGLEQFDLEPTADEEALNVHVCGEVIGYVKASD